MKRLKIEVIDNKQAHIEISGMTPSNVVSDLLNIAFSLLNSISDGELDYLVNCKIFLMGFKEFQNTSFKKKESKPLA